MKPEMYIWASQKRAWEDTPSSNYTVPEMQREVSKNSFLKVDFSQQKSLVKELADLPNDFFGLSFL